MRSLSPEEAQLWARVAGTIRPLSREASAPQQTEKKYGTANAPKLVEHSARPPSSVPPKSVPIGEKTLDGSWDKKLRVGSAEPDRVLDLHGMNLDTAWSAIDRGLDQAIARGDRVLLLITGHHRLGEPPVQRGKIRAAVHDWRRGTRLRSRPFGARTAATAERAASISS